MKLSKCFIFTGLLLFELTSQSKFMIKLENNLYSTLEKTEKFTVTQVLKLQLYEKKSANFIELEARISCAVVHAHNLLKARTDHT